MDYIRIQLFQLILENKTKFYLKNTPNNFVNKIYLHKEYIKSINNINNNKLPINDNYSGFKNNCKFNDEKNLCSYEKLIFQLEKVIAIINNKVKEKSNERISKKINIAKNLFDKNEIKSMNPKNTNNYLFFKSNLINKPTNSKGEINFHKNSKNVKVQIMNFINN
jgi:hypothetical protein